MAAQLRPRKARRCSSQGSFVDPEELTRRLSLLLIQEQCREREGQSSKEDKNLVHARQEEAERSIRSSRTQSAITSASSQKTPSQTSPTTKLAPAPRLLLHASPTSQPAGRKIPFIKWSQRTANPFDSPTSNFRANDEFQVGQRLRCESAPDLQSIKELEQGAVEMSKKNCGPERTPVKQNRRFSVMPWLGNKSRGWEGADASQAPSQPLASPKYREFLEEAGSSGGTSSQSRTRSVLLEIVEAYEEPRPDKEAKEQTEHHSNDATLINSKRSSTGLQRAPMSRKRSSILKKLDSYWFVKTRPAVERVTTKTCAEDDDRALRVPVKPKKLAFLSKLRL